ncbi:MAG: NADH-quinone oxidoreductase subunit M [Verrucomicrobiota bacterium]
MSPLLLLILLPLASSLLIMVGANPRRTALGAAFLNLVLSVLLFARYDLHAGGWQFVSEWHVLPNLGINLSLGADGLSLTMLLLSTLVTFSALWIAPKIEKREGLYYICLLFISAGVIGAFSTLDVFFLYSFHELALIPTFILIGVWGSGDRQAAAWKATIYLGAASFVLLVGLIALYLSLPSGIRTFDLRQLDQLAAAGTFHPASWIYLLLLVGFGTLVSLFPFHSWAPPAYACAPTPAAMLHSGVLKKFGLYGLIRICLPLFPEAMQQFSLLLVLMLIGNILYIGYVTVAQKRLDWTIGYSSVMHMGYIFLGLASLTVIGVHGAALLMFAHGLSVAAAFALCGEIRRRTGTLDYSELGGIGKVTPVLGLLFGFAAMASVGLPGFANFAGEILVFFGATFSSVYGPAMILAVIVGVWGVVVSAIYMLRAYRSVFWGPIAARWETLTDITPTAKWSVILLLVPLMIAGFYPQFILNMVGTIIPR